MFDFRMLVWIIIWAIIGGIPSYVICKFAIKSPVHVKFDDSFLSWGPAILVAFLWILVAFLLDLLIGACANGFYKEYLISYSGEKDLTYKAVYIVIKALENGVLIPIFIPLVSHLFGSRLNKLGLTYTPIYTVKLSKICFTVLTSLIIVRLFFYVDFSDETGSNEILVVRLLMWGMALFGTWLGFGYKCEPIFDEELDEDDNKKKSLLKKAHVKIDNIIKCWSRIFKGILDKLKNLTWEKIKKGLPIIFSFIVCLAVLVLPLDYLLDKEKGLPYSISFLCSFTVILLIGCIYQKCTINTPEKWDKEEFDKVYKNYMRTGEKSEGSFGSMKYYFYNNELVIEAVEYIYEGPRNDEFVDAFKKETIKFCGTRDYSLDDPEKIKEYLMEKRRKQNDLYDVGVKAIKQKMKRDKRDHMRKELCNF